MDDPVDGLVLRGVERRAREQADGQVGARAPRSAARRSGARSAARGGRQRVGALVPGRDRVRLVEPADVRDLLPELVERLVGRQVGEDELRPRPGRARARPSSSSSASPITFRISLMNGSWSRPARSGSRSSSRPVVVGPGERDARRALLAEREHPVAEPRRARTRACRRRRSAIRARLTYGSKYWTSTNFAPRLYALSAIARASSYWPWSAPTVTIWPGWTLAPSATARSARRR